MWISNGCNAQHCLLVLVKKCREVLGKEGYAGILLTDFSKAFNCINHELLIASYTPMLLVWNHQHLFKTLYLTESKGLKSTLLSLNIVMLNQEYRKGQYLDLSCLIFSFVICS